MPLAEVEPILPNTAPLPSPRDELHQRAPCGLFARHSSQGAEALSGPQPQSDQLLRFLTVKLEENVEIEARRALAEERKRLRIERMAALKAEEEAEARYRAEAEEAEDELAVEADA